MKRDMDLVRLILLDLESRTPQEQMSDFGLDLKAMAESLGTDLNTLTYHLILLFEGGFIDGWAVRGKGRDAGKKHELDRDYVSYVAPRHLTWAGQELLETVRDAEVWKRTKGAAKQVGSFGLDTLKELGKGFIKQKIKQHTGVEIDLSGDEK